MSNILEVKDLKVSYGGIEAVRGISFDVPEGEVVTLIGANGAGKSSTLRAIAGLEKASGGIGGSGGIIEVTCPGCGHTYKIKDQTVKINCSCGTSFYPVAR